MRYTLLKKKQGLAPRPCTILNAQQFVDVCYKHAVGQGFVHVDFETNGLEAHFFPDIRIVSIGLAAQDIAPVAVDARDWGVAEWDAFYHLLSHRGWVAYNMAFDGAHMYSYARDTQLEPPPSWEEKYLSTMKGCSLTLFRHLTNDGVVGQRHTLEVAISDYLGWGEGENQKMWLSEVMAKYKLKKSEMFRLLDLETEQFLAYNAMDAEASFQIWEHLVQDIKANGWQAVGRWHSNEGMDQIRELIVQQHHGILVDREKMTAHMAALKDALRKAEGAFRAHTKVNTLIQEWEEAAAKEWWKPVYTLKHVYAKKKDFEAGLFKEDGSSSDVCDEAEEGHAIDREWQFIPRPNAENDKTLTAWERKEGGRYYKRACTVRVKNANKPPPKFNVASPDQLRWLLFTGPKPLFRHEIREETFQLRTGEMRSTFIGVVFVPDENGVEREVEIPLTSKGDMPTGKEIAPALGEVGALLQRIAKLEQEIGFCASYLDASERTGFVHPQFKPHGTATGRLSATGGVNCFPPSVEILTRRGWVGATAVLPTDEVWAVDKDSRQGHWEVPTTIINKEYDGELVTFLSRYGSIPVTADHRMLYVGCDKHSATSEQSRREVRLAGEPLTRKKVDMFCSSLSATPSPHSEREIAIACLLQADGTKRKDRRDVYAIGVRKEAKRLEIDRLLGQKGRMLKMPCGQWQWHWSYVKFKSDLLVDKQFSLASLGTEWADHFVACLSKWDSYDRKTKGGAIEYSSTVEKNVDEVQAYLTRAGYRVTKNTHIRAEGGGVVYALAIRKKSTTCFGNGKETSHYTGRVGCVTVSTGFIQVRSNGNVIVTGNCQQWPKSEGFLSCFVPRKGNKFVDFDISAVEPTVQAEFSKDKALMELYANPNKNVVHDIYLYLSLTMHPSAEFRKELAAAYVPSKEVLEELKKKYKKERTMMKAPILSLGYNVGAKKMKRGLGIRGFNITIEEAQYIKESYWRTFSGLAAFADKLKQERRARGGWIMNGMGHPIAVPDDYEKDILNRFTQNTGHCILMKLNTIVRKRCLEEGLTDRIRPIVQDFHDERIMEVPDELVEKYVAICNEAVVVLNKQLGGLIPIKISPDVGETIWKFKS